MSEQCTLCIYTCFLGVPDTGWMTDNYCRAMPRQFHIATPNSRTVIVHKIYYLYGSCFLASRVLVRLSISRVPWGGLSVMYSLNSYHSRVRFPEGTSSIISIVNSTLMDVEAMEITVPKSLMFYPTPGCLLFYYPL
jgi:hypothetical protein